jgi:aspartate/methionine/tyrosine aminotransferase
LGGFQWAFTGCFDMGDSVVIASSGYPCYHNIFRALGCKMASIPINEELEASEDPMKCLFMSSLSNPTGPMLNPKKLKELCELCEAEKIQSLSDKIYHGICYGAEEATARQFSSEALIINSFSKYNSSI